MVFCSFRRSSNDYYNNQKLNLRKFIWRFESEIERRINEVKSFFKKNTKQLGNSNSVKGKSQKLSYNLFSWFTLGSSNKYLFVLVVPRVLRKLNQWISKEIFGTSLPKGGKMTQGNNGIWVIQARDCKEIVKSGKDPIYFINTYCRISHPQRGLIKFDTYPYQDDLFKILTIFVYSYSKGQTVRNFNNHCRLHCLAD